ncbi:HlyD family secretion protein [Clostridium aminobutyricum]|uniref:HlyD family secretion protein n=1 Tax=Clostridium aminobutyricum TaxID=33953 RepID=A0A939IHD8_CLOAM|nr:HlyD family efflux transporter periplasmic adaptor subunit [Clostridium aminobutyricum]MBN7771806.1 HlyD family secretion protein [Clostridium aminobutyricum]
MKNKKVRIILGSLIVVLAVVWGYFGYQNTHYITTDDAKVDATIIKISPQISGKMKELSFEENQMVEENQILARQSDESLPSGANIDMTVIRSPISGQIIKKMASVGEMGNPSVPIALMVNPSQLYITANIEEDKIESVKVGQEVHFTVDSFSKVWFRGKVESIGSAANSMTSLLSVQSSGNSFIKVTQRIPVKISFSGEYEEKLLPGMNAEVKIYL